MAMTLNTRPTVDVFGDDATHPPRVRVELAATQRMLVVVLLPPLLLALVISALYLTRLNHPAEVAAQEHGLALVTSLAPAATLAMLSGTPQDLAALLERVHTRDGVVAATLFNRDGRMAASHGHATLVNAAHVAAIAHVQMITQASGRLGLFKPLGDSPPSAADLLPLASPAHATGQAQQPLGWLYVELDTGAIAQWQSTRSKTLLMLVLVTLAITTAAALRLGRSISLAHAAMNDTIDEVTGEFAYQASHDPLTGLPNRRAFELALQKAVSASRRMSDQDSLCFIDLDHFKEINDTCGHAAGDALLCEVANLMRQRLRAQDLICRFGGDEFALILHGCTTGDARRIANELCKALADLRFEWEGQYHRIGASIGLARIIDPSETPADVLKAADSACYAAKHSGRNCVVEHCDTVKRQN